MDEVKPNQVREPESRSKKKGKDKPKPKQTQQAKPETVAGVLKQALENRAKSKQPGPIKLSKGDMLKRYHETRTKHILYGLVSFACFI